MKDKHCTNCGQTFGCGSDAGSCWCSAMPQLPASALTPGADCLCPSCLDARLARADAEQASPLRAPAADPAG